MKRLSALGLCLFLFCLSCVNTNTEHETVQLSDEEKVVFRVYSLASVRIQSMDWFLSVYGADSSQIIEIKERFESLPKEFLELKKNKEDDSKGKVHSRLDEIFSSLAEEHSSKLNLPSVISLERLFDLITYYNAIYKTNCQNALTVEDVLEMSDAEFFRALELEKQGCSTSLTGAGGTGTSGQNSSSGVGDIPIMPGNEVGAKVAACVSNFMNSVMSDIDCVGDRLASGGKDVGSPKPKDDKKDGKLNPDRIKEVDKKLKEKRKEHTEKTEEKKKLESQKKDLESELDNTSLSDEQKSEIKGQIADIDSQLSNINDQLGKLEEDINELEIDLYEVEALTGQVFEELEDIATDMAAIFSIGKVTGSPIPGLLGAWNRYKRFKELNRYFEDCFSNGLAYRPAKAAKLQFLVRGGTQGGNIQRPIVHHDVLNNCLCNG